MSALGNVFQQAGKQSGGLAKHVVKRVGDTPFEILKNAVGIKPSEINDDSAMEIVEQGGQTQANTNQSDDFSGFKTRGDFDKYTELSRKRDDILLRMQRRQLAEMYGINHGMQKARMEREQDRMKEERVEEHEEEQKKLFIEEKKKEFSAVASAKAQSGVETRVGNKIAG